MQGIQRHGTSQKLKLNFKTLHALLTTYFTYNIFLIQSLKMPKHNQKTCRPGSVGPLGAYSVPP